MWPFRARVEHVEAAWFEKYGKSAQYTPDIIELEKKMRLNIFVHDDMMKGGSLHEYLSETNIAGRWPTHTGYTVDEFYHWKKDLGEQSYSVALEDPVSGFLRNREELKPARIQGEIYSIRPRQITKLDFLRENGLQFFRKRVEIFIPHSKVIYSSQNPVPYLIDPKKQTMTCWMYFGNGYYWDDQLAGVIPSSPIPRLIHNREDIGTFTRFEIPRSGITPTVSGL